MDTEIKLAAALRVALLVPSSNTVMENDLHEALPKHEYTIHTDRMYLVETTRQAEQRMIEEFAAQAAGDLGTVEPDVLIFGCTSAGSLFGLDYDAKVCRELGALAGCASIGVVSAVAQALDRQAACRLAVITPYNEDLTNSVASAVSAGRKIVCAYGMGITNNVALADPTPADIVAFARDKLAGKSFDGVFVSCTNFRAYEARAALEKALGVPVVTSNSAVVDAIHRFRESGVRRAGMAR
jgi:maleate isomerase